MPSLKEFRVRIASVQSTKKITSAMKMVAASKLRRSQEAAEAARPYAERMERMLGNLAGAAAGRAGAAPMLAGTGKDDVHLIVVMTANRGLCGGFNSNIIRSARGLVRELLEKGKTVKILAVGRKGSTAMRRDFKDLLGRESLHPGMIAIPQTDKETAWRHVLRALAFLDSLDGDPMDQMVNRSLDFDRTGRPSLHPFPERWAAAAQVARGCVGHRSGAASHPAIR